MKINCERSCKRGNVLAIFGSITLLLMIPLDLLHSSRYMWIKCVDDCLLILFFVPRKMLVLLKKYNVDSAKPLRRENGCNCSIYDCNARFVVKQMSIYVL